MQLNNLPYKGAGPLMIDLLAGGPRVRRHGHFGAAGEGRQADPACGHQTRNPVLPDVPTVHEAGVPGYEVRTWYAIWAIRGTPQAIKDRMYKEIVAAISHPDLKRIWAEQGADAGGMPPAEMEKVVKSEIAKWAKVVKDAGAKVDN